MSAGLRLLAFRRRAANAKRGADIMTDHWPGICAAAALLTLLVLVIRYHVHAFIALFVVSLGLGLAAGLPPAQVVDAIHKGIADILRDVVLLLALGAML